MTAVKNRFAKRNEYKRAVCDPRYSERLYQNREYVDSHNDRRDENIRRCRSDSIDIHGTIILTKVSEAYRRIIIINKESALHTLRAYDAYDADDKISGQLTISF